MTRVAPDGTLVLPYPVEVSVRALTRPLVLAAVVLGAVAVPASAATRCAGEESTAYVCVTTPPVGWEDHTYCVYAGGSSCTDVTVPLPDASGSVDVTCGGQLNLLRYLCG